MGVFLSELLDETTMYWERFDQEPIEINARWFDDNIIVSNSNGNILRGNSKVYVDRNVNEGGYLLKISDLNDDFDKDNSPEMYQNARRIVRFQKRKSITDELFVYEAYVE